MEKPWEIVQNFQKNLNPVQMSLNCRQIKSVTGQGVVQRFLPTRGLQDAALRIKRVKDMVDESVRIADESRPRALNNTTVSFCQNCSCANCLNQSSILAPVENNLNSTFPELLHSFDLFLNTQRQQFMQMIQQLMVNAMDVSSSTEMNSISADPPPTAVECDSSNKTKPKEDRSIAGERSFNKCGEQVAANHMLRSPCEKPSSTVPSDEDAFLSHDKATGRSIENIIEKHNFLKPNVPGNSETSRNSKTHVSKDDSKHGPKLNLNGSSKHLNTTNLYCDPSFSDYEDVTFRPVRKSSFEKFKNSILEDQQTSFYSEPESTCTMSDCYVPLTNCTSDKIVEKSKNARARSNLQDSTTLPLEAVKRMELISEPTNPVTRTRSGRTVSKPQEYWLSKRPYTTVLEEISERKSGKRRAARPRKQSPQSGTVVATNNMPKLNGKKQVDGRTIQSNTLKRSSNVVSEKAETAFASKQSHKKAKATAVRRKQSQQRSVCKSNDGTRAGEEKTVQEVDASLHLGNAERVANINQVDDTFRKNKNATDKVTKKRRNMVARKEVPVQETENKLIDKKENKKGKRKNQSNSVTNNTQCKRQKLISKVTRQPSTDSMEPEYECYFADSREDSWIEA